MASETPDLQPEPDPGSPLTEEENTRVRAWAERFRQEFDISGEDKSVSGDIRTQLIDLAEDAITKLGHFIKYEQNPALSLKATLWLLDSLLGGKGLIKIDDPVLNYLEEMKEAENK